MGKSVEQQLEHELCFLYKNHALPVIIKVEQQIEQGLWIENHAPLVVMRVEQLVEHGLCYFLRQPCTAYIVRVEPKQTSVSFGSLKTMLRLVSNEMNKSWYIVSVLWDTILHQLS